MKTLEDRFEAARLDVQRGVGRLPTQPVGTLERRELRRRAGSLALLGGMVVVVVVALAAITPAPVDVAGPWPVAQATPETIGAQATPETTETVPFSGDDWQMNVGEGPNDAQGTRWKVCHTFTPGGATEANGFGPSGCVNWPEDATETTIMDAMVFASPGGQYLLFVDLTDEPVDTVSVLFEDGSKVDVNPFAMPGSGKQFAVVELPDESSTLSVELVDGAGTVIESRQLDDTDGDAESKEPTPPTEPADEHWADLPGGVAVALGPDDNGQERIWVRSAVSAPEPARDTGTRTLFVPVSDTHLAIVIVSDEFMKEEGLVGIEKFGQPDEVKVHWEGLVETDIVSVDWSGDPWFGVALVQDRGGAILDVEPLPNL